MLQNVPNDSKSAQMTPTSPGDKWCAYGTLRSRLCADLRTPPLPPWGGEGIFGGAWGSPEAGTPHGIRGWGSKRPSPAAMLHCFCRTRDLPICTRQGEPPAYCLSLCRRPSGHGMYIARRMQRQRVGPLPTAYVLLDGRPSQGLAEPTVCRR